MGLRVMIWPISMIAIFGYRYIIKWYEQDRSQLLKLLCIIGLAASGFILIYWGFTLGIIVAGTVQIIINMVEYSNDPVKLEAELGAEFKFGAMDMVELILMMAIMATICVIAFKALKSYLKVLRPNAAGQFLSRRVNPAGPGVSSVKPGRIADKTADENKPQRINTVFCPKCGSRIAEDVVVCPSCGRKPKNSR